MRETIHICTQNPDGSLTIRETRRLLLTLEENSMTLWTTFRNRRYQVNGNCYFCYIVTECAKEAA